MKKLHLNGMLFIIPNLFFCSCISSESDITKIEVTSIQNLPTSLSEVSGITNAKNTLWAVQDNGNSNEIHQINSDGKLIKSIPIPTIKNKDWEAITSDSDGNLYIGDFGNNDNDRKNLAIHKINKSELVQNSINTVETISFYYEDQKDFPPKKNKLQFDCESFILYEGNFYLFTKNRSKDFDGTCNIYKVPNIPGNHKAILVDSYVTSDKFSSGAITDAALSPDNKKLVLLSNKRLWIFDHFNGDKFTKGNVKMVEFKTYTQREGITFKDNSTLIITDEKTKKVGGNIYEYNLDK